MTVHWQPTMLKLHRDSSFTTQGPKIATWEGILLLNLKSGYWISDTERRKISNNNSVDLTYCWTLFDKMHRIMAFLKFAILDVEVESKDIVILKSGYQILQPLFQRPIITTKTIMTNTTWPGVRISDPAQIASLSKSRLGFPWATVGPWDLHGLGLSHLNPTCAPPGPANCRPLVGSNGPGPLWPVEIPYGISVG